MMDTHEKAIEAPETEIEGEAGAEYLLAAPEQEMSDEAPLHILRVGPIFDLDTGKLILDVSEDLAREVATTTQALISAGVVVPISMEHGIERAGRGDTSADMRPYGQVLSIWYDEEKKGVYATKEWSNLGLSMVTASLTPGGSALRISPRVKVKPAYHPQTAELLGNASIDTASLTTLPRQDSVNAVGLSREMSSENTEQMFTNDTKDDNLRTSDPAIGTGEQTETGLDEPKGQTMTKTTEKAEVAPEVGILLGRNSSEATAILGNLGLGDDCGAVELAKAVDGLKGQLADTVAELNRFKTEKAEAALQLRTVEANELLDNHEIKNTAERDLYLAALLAEDPAQVEMARGALNQRGKPDNQGRINECIELAKGRGALPGDFALEDEALVQNVETVIAVLNRIPDGNTVRIGEPEGSTTAGLDGDLGEMDRAAAGEELSRLTRIFHNDNPDVTRIEALNITKAAHPELAQAAFNTAKGN